MTTPLRSLLRAGLGTALCAALIVPAARGQIATALLTEDGLIPGAGGATADALNNTAVNHVGGYACSITSSDGLSRVWGNAIGGPGAPLRTEGTVGDLEQTSFESFYGISDTGQVSYSATCVNTVTGATGLDSVWLDGTVVAIEEDAAPNPAGYFWSFASRPGVTADGTPYFVGGVTDTQGGSTDLRGLFYGLGAGTVLLAGDAVPNLPFPIDTGASSIDFDYRFSANGTNYMCPVTMDTGSTSDDGVIVQSGAGLLLDGQLVREASPVPAAVGGLPDENWDNFDFQGITESGKYFFTGDTDADTDLDEFILVDGVIRHREGDMLDGFVLSGSIEGAYMNEQGDLAFIWDVDDPDLGNVEALYFNGALLLKEGDEVDITGDGVVDPGAVISGFTGISSLTVGDQMGGGFVNIYFTADVDTEGTGSTLDDVEGFFCLPAQGAECFLVFGPGPGQSIFEPGTHPFVPQISDVVASWAVLLEDVAEIELPPALGAGNHLDVQLFDGNVNPLHELLMTGFAVQVVMWNPYVFPHQPEQFSHGLYVRMGPNGRLHSYPYGESTGMEVWTEIVTQPDGTRVLRFPFSIPGL